MDPDRVYDLVPDSTVWSDESNSRTTVLMVEDENGNIVEVEEYFPNRSENIPNRPTSSSSSSRSSRSTTPSKQNFKVPTHLLQHITRQDRQLSRIQQDQVRRTEQYKELKLKHRSGNLKLQNQINTIRTEFSQTSETLNTDLSLLNTRLVHCEQKQAQTLENVGSEFLALRNVMALVCDSINRIEERSGAVQECLYRGQQQQQSSFSQLEDPQLQDPLVTISVGTAPSPAPVPVPVASPSSTETTSPVTATVQPGRVDCPLCSKTLSKYYIQNHIKNFCKKRVVS